MLVESIRITSMEKEGTVVNLQTLSTILEIKIRQTKILFDYLCYYFCIKIIENNRKGVLLSGYDVCNFFCNDYFMACLLWIIDLSEPVSVSRGRDQ